MVVFPEGTRYNPEMTAVVEKSKSFAIEQGTALIKILITYQTCKMCKVLLIP